MPTTRHEALRAAILDARDALAAHPNDPPVLALNPSGKSGRRSRRSDPDTIRMMTMGHHPRRLPVEQRG
ncbi:hypothetical protein [Embleya sp. MST-111070]|uniref:hypothetical protein n=1 Tax=Embleya sp. MST-111070 TaxID=3398231 RepID=UPI003F738116